MLSGRNAALQSFSLDYLVWSQNQNRIPVTINRTALVMGSTLKIMFLVPFILYQNLYLKVFQLFTTLWTESDAFCLKFECSINRHQSFARGCWSAILSSWLCLCVSCVLAVFSGFLNGSQDALWLWRGEAQWDTWDAAQRRIWPSLTSSTIHILSHCRECIM